MLTQITFLRNRTNPSPRGILQIIRNWSLFQKERKKGTKKGTNSRRKLEKVWPLACQAMRVEKLFDIKQTHGVNGGVVNFDKKWRRGNIPRGSLASLLRVTDPNERLQSLSPSFSSIYFLFMNHVILIRVDKHFPIISFSL